MNGERTVIEYLLLADAVQVIDGKIHVAGGGFDTMLVQAVPQTTQLAIACGVLVPWGEAGKEHTLTVSVATADGRALAPPHRQTFRTGRAAALLHGAPVHVPFAITWELTFPDYGRYAVTASVAAASVVAKVVRDRLMTRLAKEFPEYGFEIHKGYGTKMHYDALKKHGLCAIHRRSFIHLDFKPI